MRDALAELGWDERWRALFEPYAQRELTPARVIRSDRGSVLVGDTRRTTRAAPSARLLKLARGAADLAVVGDWVAMMDAEAIDVPLIEAVLPRASAITRGDPGEDSRDVQVLAANVDTVFVVHPIAEPPNVGRIERELALAWDWGAVPVVVLTKADLSLDPDAARVTVESIALCPGCRDDERARGRERRATARLHAWAPHRRPARALRSGEVYYRERPVGTAAAGTPGAVRANDQRGRHTTVARELIGLPDGGLLIDTPGLRRTRPHRIRGRHHPDVLRRRAACQRVPVSRLRTPR